LRVCGEPPDQAREIAARGTAIPARSIDPRFLRGDPAWWVPLPLPLPLPRSPRDCVVSVEMRASLVSRSGMNPLVAASPIHPG